MYLCIDSLDKTNNVIVVYKVLLEYFLRPVLCSKVLQNFGSIYLGLDYCALLVSQN